MVAGIRKALETKLQAAMLCGVAAWRSGTARSGLSPAPIRRAASNKAATMSTPSTANNTKRTTPQE